jgi:hypothetical protein
MSSSASPPRALAKTSSLGFRPHVNAYCVPTVITAYAQECHLMAGHVLCEYVEEAFRD